MARNDSNRDNYTEPAPNLQSDFVHTTSKNKDCNDVFFLILFLAVFIMTFVFAVSFGASFLDATSIQDASSSITTGYRAVLEDVAYSGLSAIGISILWVVIMIFTGECLIWSALLLIIAINVILAVVLTKQFHDLRDEETGERVVSIYYWPAIVFGTIAVLTAMYTCCIRKRIKFAAKHLKVAGSAILTLPMTLVVAFTMLVVQFGWSITWMLGTAGILFENDYIVVPSPCRIGECKVDFEAGETSGVTIAMLLVFFWGAYVNLNIVHVTVAGSIASWKIKSGAPLITVMSWLRSVTLSLGSICFGSLIVAILETIKSVLNGLSWAAGKSGNCVASCLLGCLSCIIGCIENLIKIFNRFAYSYVGIYGYSFMTAGRHTFALFANKGWSAIVNDNLTGNVFFLAQLSVALMTAAIGVKIVEGADDPERYANISNPRWVVGPLAGILGYVVAKLFMSVMASAVTTVFILWAEDPHGWQLTHPDHYESLHSAWLEIYPEEYNNGHGKANDTGDRL